MTFFIMGLPRSRTAWLANFFTYDGLFCYHEGFEGCQTVSQYQSKLWQWARGGDSSSALYMIDVDKLFPGCKKIIIHSNTKHAIDYYKRVFDYDVEEAMVVLDAIYKQKTGLHVQVEDINDRLEEMWSYITPRSFDNERARMLTNLNIQQHNPEELAKQHEATLGLLLEDIRRIS